MSQYNASMMKIFDEMPVRMKALPITEDGWPTLWFASITQEGKPDLRCADPRKRAQAVMQDRCWLCGEPLGVYKVFVIGPMCSITRTTAEPPCHRECAEFATIACPFLTRPKMKRNSADMPEGHEPPPGLAIMRNPGATCLWTCKDYELIRVGQGPDWMIHLGNPTEVHWYAEGKPATREQVLASIESGFPLVQAEAEKGGPKAIRELSQQRRAIESMLPAESA